MKHRPAARLTLHPLLALAFLPVLLLELGYQPLVHIPGHFTQRRLLFLLYRTEGRRQGGGEGGEGREERQKHVVSVWMQYSSNPSLRET